MASYIKYFSASVSAVTLTALLAQKAEAQQSLPRAVQEFAAACNAEPPSSRSAWCYDSREKLAYPMNPDQARNAVEFFIRNRAFDRVFGISVGKYPEGICEAIPLEAEEPYAGYPHAIQVNVRTGKRIIGPENSIKTASGYKSSLSSDEIDKLELLPGNSKPAVSGTVGCFQDSASADFERSRINGKLDVVMLERAKKYVIADEALKNGFLVLSK